MSNYLHKNNGIKKCLTSSSNPDWVGVGEVLKVLRRNPSAILPNYSASPEFSWNSPQ